MPSSIVTLLRMRFSPHHSRLRLHTLRTTFHSSAALALLSWKFFFSIIYSYFTISSCLLPWLDYCCLFSLSHSTYQSQYGIPCHAEKNTTRMKCEKFLLLEAEATTEKAFFGPIDNINKRFNDRYNSVIRMQLFDLIRGQSIESSLITWRGGGRRVS